MNGESVTVIIIFIFVIAFICATLHLSFGHEDPEVKVVGLTFFISLFLIGPFFSGLISISAPAPNSPDNRIEVVSILVAVIMSAIALGIYKVISEIKYRVRERKRTKILGRKKGSELDIYSRIAEGDNRPVKKQLSTSVENDNRQHELYFHSDILEIRITEIEHYKYNGYEYLDAYYKIKNVGAVPISRVSILMDIPFPEEDGYVESHSFYHDVIQPGQTINKCRAGASIAGNTLIKEEATKCIYDYRLLQADEYGITEYCVDKNKQLACEGRIPVKGEKKKTRWELYNP